MIDSDSIDGINIINNNSSESSFRPLVTSEPSSQPSELFAFSPSPSSMSKSNANLLTCMLITANVGTIFEESNLLELWFQQLKSNITKVKPQLVAIHCQEVGGKNYESSMKHVSNFTDKIIGDDRIIGDYTRVRIFLDENFESLEKFTALGSLYLIHDSVQNIKLYNFKTAQYESVEGRKVYAGNSTNKAAEHVEKVKFPQELFPECRWSRKGFMRTRWLFNDSQPLDLVNIHLFHDASNIVAMEKTPSPYAQNRQQALEFTLRKISSPLGERQALEQSQQKSQSKTDAVANLSAAAKTQSNQVPLFIFGDFNFRLDTNKVIQRITEGVSPVVKRSAESNEVLEFVYHRREDSKTNSSYLDEDLARDETSRKEDDGNSNYIDGGGVVMTVGKKIFDCENLDETFRATKNTEWLQELDNELDRFKNQLFEFKISFSPSYPFKEDITGGYSYMKTRCPAWCDRILFNAAGSNMIRGNNLLQRGSMMNSIAAQATTIDSEKRMELLQSNGDVVYRLMGNTVPMGDHKPVLLYCQLDLPSKADSWHATTAATTTATVACNEEERNTLSNL